MAGTTDSGMKSNLYYDDKINVMSIHACGLLYTVDSWYTFVETYSHSVIFITLCKCRTSVNEPLLNMDYRYLLSSFSQINNNSMDVLWN